jgi:hypothetical protein
MAESFECQSTSARAALGLRRSQPVAANIARLTPSIFRLSPVVTLEFKFFVYLFI